MKHFQIEAIAIAFVATLFLNACGGSGSQMEKEARKRNPFAYPKTDVKLDKETLIISNTPELDGVYRNSRASHYNEGLYFGDNTYVYVFDGKLVKQKSLGHSGSATMVASDKIVNTESRRYWLGDLHETTKTEITWSDDLEAITYNSTNINIAGTYGFSNDVYRKVDGVKNPGLEMYYGALNTADRNANVILPGCVVLDKMDTTSVASLITEGDVYNSGITRKIHITPHSIPTDDSNGVSRTYKKDKDLLTLYIANGNALYTKAGIYYGTIRLRDVKVFAGDNGKTHEFIGVSIENRDDPDAWYTGDYQLRGAPRYEDYPLVDWVPSACYHIDRHLIFTPPSMGGDFIVADVDDSRASRIWSSQRLTSVNEIYNCTIKSVDHYKMTDSERGRNEDVIALVNDEGKVFKPLNTNSSTYLLAEIEDMPSDILEYFGVQRVHPLEYSVPPLSGDLDWLPGYWAYESGTRDAKGNIASPMYAIYCFDKDGFFFLCHGYGTVDNIQTKNEKDGWFTADNGYLTVRFRDGAVKLIAYDPLQHLVAITENKWMTKIRSLSTDDEQ